MDVVFLPSPSSHLDPGSSRRPRADTKTHIEQTPGKCVSVEVDVGVDVGLRLHARAHKAISAASALRWQSE